MLKLSVLVATMPSRQLLLEKLVAELHTQITYFGAQGQVEVLWDASMEYNVGKKRNLLLNRAQGEMVVYADDDDTLSPEYIPLIIKAAKSGPDCIGISGTVIINNEPRQWHISKEYGEWKEENGVYLRTPNHISPVRRELALKAGFPEIAFSEDHGYSMRLLPMLQTEVIIPGNIYFYTPSKK